MNLVTLYLKNPYLMLKNILSKQREMAQESFSGLEARLPRVSGMASMPKSWLTKGHNTLIRRTIGPNTITIRTTSTRPPSKGTSSNTTTRTTSLAETTNGSSNENVSMSLPRWTSPIL